MTTPMPSDTCPKCGGELRQTDKNTFTGEIWREYTCRSCGHIVDINEGIALWQILHDAAEKDRQDKDGK
jgi:rubredoxin